MYVVAMMAALRSVVTNKFIHSEAGDTGLLRFSWLPENDLVLVVFCFLSSFLQTMFSLSVVFRELSVPFTFEFLLLSSLRF